MDITNRLKNAVAAFRKTNNSGGVDPNSFLRYGSRKMASTWSTPDINDEDFYTGYGFAVINKRANRSVVLGKKFLYTEAKPELIKKANEKNSKVIHPYLNLIRESTEFSERDFWYNISTYLDLEGIYYLMAVRAVTKNGKVGNIQKFSLLNPYWVRPIINSKGELGGYVESNPGKGQRDIPKEMVIPIRLLNPFDPSRPYALADAARDSQFTLKQANDYARESINGNINAPGILSSAIELPDDQFDNFVSRIKDHSRGEPLFGNGSGTVSWVDMQTDLDKAALDKINSINRDVLLAISGLSKTGVGVEESGTGREVSRTQKDDFTENAIMPQIENIIDSLNLDYRTFYADQWAQNNYQIALDNPLETARDSEKVDVDVRDAQVTLRQKLIDEGYDQDTASRYAKGEIDITDLGEPVNEPKATPPPVAPAAPVTPPTPPADTTPPAKKKKPTPPTSPANSYKNKQFNVFQAYPVPVTQYLEETADQVQPLSEKGSFVYSTKEELSTATIDHIEEVDNSLIAVVDEDTFIKLADFKTGADRVAIVAKLNRRYKQQPVAVKKKIDLSHDHDDNIAEVIKNTAFDKQAQIDSSQNDLLTSAQAAEDKLYQWYVDQIGVGIANPHPVSNQEFVNSLTLPFAVYFTVLFPIYASSRIQQTSKDLNVNDQLPVVAITDEIKQTINDFATREATSHINTLQTDLENALAIIRAKTSDPTEMKDLFNQAYAQIRARRSEVIANTAAVKIFNLSQYEADLQFLTRAGLVGKAYKQLFSLTGDPCPFCAALIASSTKDPIPFTEAFASLGDTLEADGKKLKLNYESIIAGNVHPNCRCAYKLVVNTDTA